jgi:hypothetical protein
MLTTEQVLQYQEQGFLLLPVFFSVATASVMCNQVSALVKDESTERVLEKNQKSIRSILGVHLKNEFFSNLLKTPNLITDEEVKQKSETFLADHYEYFLYLLDDSHLDNSIYKPEKYSVTA